MEPRNYTTQEVANQLLKRKINATSQRIEIARVILSRCTHLSAEDVFTLVNNDQCQVSKATVYNTLGLFAKKGLIREVIADPNRIFYDPNTAPHHHFYNVTTGELVDIDASDMQVSGLPALPEGTHMEGVDVIVRLRPTA